MGSIRTAKYLRDEEIAHAETSLLTLPWVAPVYRRRMLPNVRSKFRKICVVAQKQRFFITCTWYWLVHSKQNILRSSNKDLTWCIKIGEYIFFRSNRGFRLVCPPPPEIRNRFGIPRELSPGRKAANVENLSIKSLLGRSQQLCQTENSNTANLTVSQKSVFSHTKKTVPSVLLLLY